MHRKLGLRPFSKGRSREWSGLWQAIPLLTIPQLGHPKPAEGRLARRKPAALCLSDVKQGWMTWREHIKDISDGRAESQPPEDCLAEDSVHLAGWWHRIARQYREGTVSAGRGSLCRRTGIDQKRTAAFGKPRYVTQRLTNPRRSLQHAVQATQQPSDTWNEPGAGLPGPCTAHSAGRDDA